MKASIKSNAGIIKALVLIGLFAHGFQAYGKTPIAIAGLTKSAQQDLNRVQEHSNNLFTVKTDPEVELKRKTETDIPEGSLLGTATTTKSTSYETLESRHPEFDPLLSDVPREDIPGRLTGWESAIAAAGGHMNANAHHDKQLLGALNTYDQAYTRLYDALSVYYDVQGAKLAPRITQLLQAINSPELLQLQQDLHRQRNALEKLSFSRFTFMGETKDKTKDKNSTRILLINLIDLLNRNIHTVRKRALELAKELEISKAPRQAVQAPAQQPIAAPPVQIQPVPPLTHVVDRPVISAPQRRKPTRTAFKDPQAEIRQEQEAFNAMLNNFKTHKTFAFYKQLIDQYKQNPDYIDRIVAVDDQLFENDLQRYRNARSQEIRNEIEKRWSPAQVSVKKQIQADWDVVYKNTQERYKKYQDALENVKWERFLRR